MDYCPVLGVLGFTIGFVYIALTRRVSAGAWFSAFAGAKRWPGGVELVLLTIS